MVEAERELAEHELLRVLRAALLAHGAYRGEEAARGGARDAVVERHDPGRHRAAAGVSHHAEAGRIHFGTRREHVQRTDAVPRAETRRVPAKQLCTASHVVVCAAAPEVRVLAALHALPLVDGVVAERHHARLRGLKRAALVGGCRLAVGGVPAGHHDAGTLPRELHGVGQEEVRRHVVVGLAFEIDLLHRITVTHHTARGDHVQRTPLRKSAERLHERGTYCTLSRSELRRSLARGPRLVCRDVRLVDGLEHVVVNDEVAARQQLALKRSRHRVGRT